MKKLFSCCYCPECVCVRVDALPRVARTHKRRPIVKNDVKREKTGAKNRPSGVIITPSPVTSRWTMRLCVNLILGDVSVTGGKKEPPSLNFQPATGGPLFPAASACSTSKRPSSLFNIFFRSLKTFCVSLDCVRRACVCVSVATTVFSRFWHLLDDGKMIIYTPANAQSRRVLIVQPVESLSIEHFQMRLQLLL